MTTPDDQDARLEEAFEALEPVSGEVARMRAHLHRELEGHTRSLVAEWVELLRVRPFAHGGLALAAACALLLTTPVGAVLGALVQQGGG